MLQLRTYYLDQENTSGVPSAAWAITDVAVPGLKAYAIYASGSDLINSSTGAPIGHQNETDVRLDYAFPKGTNLEGLVATFRYAWTHQDGTLQNGNQLRAYLNYAVRF